MVGQPPFSVSHTLVLFSFCLASAFTFTKMTLTTIRNSVRVLHGAFTIPLFTVCGPSTLMLFGCLLKIYFFESFIWQRRIKNITCSLTGQCTLHRLHKIKNALSCRKGHFSDLTTQPCISHVIKNQIIPPTSLPCRCR